MVWCRYVIQSSASTGSSHVRVAFDATRPLIGSRRPPAHSPHLLDKRPATGITLVSPTGDRHSPPSAHQRWEHAMRDENYRRQSVVESSLQPNGRMAVDTSPHVMSSSQEQQAAPLVGEVSVPFWVQSADGAPWCSPDEWCAGEILREVTPGDKAILWEMVAALIQHPSLALPLPDEEGCGEEESVHAAPADFTHIIRNAHDVAATFKRVEFRALWTREAADALPLDTAADLIRAVYVLGDSDALHHLPYDDQSLSEGF
jgi:hypothetical protein